MQEDMNNRNIEFLLFNRNERFENERKFYSSRGNLLKRGIGRFTREKSWLQRGNIRKKNSKQPLRHAFIVVIPALNRALGGIKHPLE